MSTNEGYNADTRARKRESQPVTIGERDFAPVRRTPKVMRRFRAIVREDEALADKLGELEDGDLQGREKVEDKREDLMYEMVAVFVAPPEGEPFDVPEFLAEQLDIEECSELLDYLTPGSAPDPTPGDTGQATSS